ncbi:AHH domain-containing protein [Archangium violaceum]|uniref:AHH domain-containing protein n=1 Tax=Archangium violaceum TaxID=83451 RepID=UPI00195143E1|nr:AHH domain-containing protein [Archangium violaceum]QRO02954.1 AHH domain-containing protein [Archangium violaceum]
MKICAIVALLLLASGCATTRIVNLDTGQGAPSVWQPVETKPIEIDEAEFKRAVVQLMLDLKLNVIHEEPEQDARLFLLASAGGVVDGAQGRTMAQSHARIGQQQSDPRARLNLLAGELTLDPTQLRMMSLFFAFDTVWEGVEEAVKDFADPAALRTMVVSMVGTALVMLVAPEPITKLVAIALTASLIAYLGTGPVWNLGQGFLRLMEESKNARTISELEDVGHRFGKVLGDNGARVLVIVALSVLGGRNATAAQGSKLPGAAQAALRAQAEGGFQLSAAWTGGVQSIAMPSAGVLNVVLAPTAVAAVAMGPGSAMQGDPEGDIHHICTNKNEISEASGGPWTPLFERYFRLARMELNDPANQVRIKGHKGPHSREYHQAVLDRIARAMQGCRGAAQCRAALVDELAKIAKDLTTAGTELRKLVTKNPEA